MSTQVSLVVTLDSNGVLTGVRQIGDGFDDLGKKANDHGKKAENAFNGIESAERRAHLAGMLFARTTGVEMPRALENVIAHSQTLGPVLAGAFNIAVIGAAIGAIITVGEKIVSVTEALAGYTEASKKAFEETKKAAEEALVNPRSLEIGQQQVENLKKQKTGNDVLAGSVSERIKKIEMEASFSDRILGIADLRASKELLINSAKDKGLEIEKQTEEVQKKVNELQEARNKLIIGDLSAKFSEAGLQGFALAAQQHRDEMARLVNEANVARAHGEFANGEPAQFAAERLTAEKEYNAKVMELRRSNANETIALQRQVLESELEGVARIKQAETDSLVEINKKVAESLLSEDYAQQQRVAVHQRAQAEIAKIYKDLQKQIDAAADAEAMRATENLTGSTKIIAQGEIERNKIKAAQEDLMLTFIMDNNERALRDKLLQDALVANDKKTAESLKQQHQELTDKLKDLQEQAAIAALPEFQRAGAQILLDRQKTFEELGRLEAKDAENAKIYEDQRVAADALANAHLRDEHKRLTEQLGGELESLYDDIAGGNLGKRILGNIKKLFAQIVAQWILSTQIMGSVFGKLFGSLVFGPGSTGAGVFGGGNPGQGGGIGSLLGGLFGGPGSPGAGGTPPFVPPGSSSLTSAGLPSFLGGQGPAGALSTSFSSSSTSSSNGIGAVAAGASSITSALSASSKGTSRLGGPGVLLATLLGGQGGNAGQIGGLLSTLAITNPQFLQGLSSALGLGDGVGQNLGSLAGILGIAGGGLTGFGLGANHGGFLGALGGAASGALTGFLVGGPAGAIIGGLVGLIGGIFGGIFGGSKRKKQANAYFSDSLEPAIKKIEDEYDSFQLDAQNAKDQLEQLRTQAQTDLGKLKSQGKDVFKKKVGPAIDTAEAHILDTEKERTRRGALAFGAPQFHDGVDFVDANSSILFRRRPDELVSVLQHGEGVVTAAGNARNPGAVAAMNAGAVVGGGGDVHVNLYPQTLDANWLRNGGAVDIAKAIRYATKEGRR